jgi:phosphohistidine swiveling domain-containing protein
MVYQQLLQVRRVAEKHFRDVCDVEFTVEGGRLFVTNVRLAKRSSISNLRFALQFLAEGLITPQEALCRITPSNVAELMRPTIRNSDCLPTLGHGIAACPGGATGRVSFRASDVLRLAQAGTPVIFVREEISPDDLPAIIVAHAVITLRGGVTSHAALACRQLQKPCVVGYSPRDSAVGVSGRPESLFREHTWITVDGTTGEVLLGKGKCQAHTWHEIPELRCLAEIVGQAIKTGNVPGEATGHVWRIHDFLFESVPLVRGMTKKQPVTRRSFTSFVMPSKRALQDARFRLVRLSSKEKPNYGETLISMMDWLLRSLAAEAGIGNHYQYFRPLWDPVQTIQQADRGKTQLVGMEFQSVNRFLPNLIDVGRVMLVLELDVTLPRTQWFLDFTNPLGESLVAISDSVLGYSLRLNRADVHHRDVPMLYNSLRTRGYARPFYEHHGTTHADIVACLSRWNEDKDKRSPLLPLCFELGLIRSQKLTNVGQSLLGKSPIKNKYESPNPSSEN